MEDGLSDEDLNYEQVDMDREGGVKPVWNARAMGSGTTAAYASASRQGAAPLSGHPQAMVASILKGDPPVVIQRSNTVKSPPQALPRSTATSTSKDNPPTLPPPNSKKVRPPAPPPPLRSGSLPAFPAVPPKPGSNLKKVRPKLEDSFVIEKEEYTPGEFVKKYSERFPLHVRVSKGFYGNSETTSVSEGDTFNIHFIKKTKVVNTEDGVGSSFNITLNSAVQFGILFNPNNNREEALRGHMYNKVSDLLPLKVLPKVIRASVGWYSGSAESTVDNHEMLVVKGWKRRLQKKFLKVFNPVTKVKKELPENCECKFSTAPYDTRLYLADIADLVVQPFPCKAVMYVNGETMKDPDIPSYLASSIVNLKGVSTYTSLLASGSSCFKTSPSTSAPMMEIPHDLDIEFQVMYPKKQKDTDDLYQTTRNLLEEMTGVKKPESPYVICPLRNPTKEGNIQNALYSVVREGSEMTGVEVVKPPAIYANLPQTKDKISSLKAPPPSSAPPTSPMKSVARSESFYSEAGSSSDISSLEDKTSVLETSLAAVESKLSSWGGVEESVSKLSRDFTSLKADIIRTDSRSMKAVEDVGKARSEIGDLAQALERLKMTCASLQNKVDSMGQSMPSLPLTPTTPQTRQSSLLVGGGEDEGGDSAYSTIDEAKCESNKQFLASLDFMQILTLLECMGLKKHQEAFMEERVNGEILMECDESVLQEELKVTSKIQRSRLMKLIQGKYSAKKILQGEDPYVYARAK